MSGYYPPPGAPPQQHGYGQPPAQQWGPPPPPQNNFQQYPNQYQQPPQQGFPQQQGQYFPPPPGPPPGHSFQQGPPPGQYGFQQGSPPGQYGFQQQPPPRQQMPQQLPQQIPPSMPPHASQQPSGQASRPSPGYGSHDIAQGNAGPDVAALTKAMSGFKRDHHTIIQILAKQDPMSMALLRQTYAQQNKGASLESKVESSFRSHYGDCLTQLVRGPLLSDAHNVNRAIKGLGTREDMLNDVLIGRSNADMQAIKSTYYQIFKRSMESDVEGDLSLKTKTMFQLIMRASRAEESTPYDPTATARDTEALQYAMKGPSVSTNQEQVFAILTQRSDNQIRAVAIEFQRKFNKSLEDMIHSNFSGHMEDALILCVLRATDRAKADAYGLEDTMKGLGTKDNLLVNKTVRIHWDRQQTDQVRKAFQHFFKRDLISRVKGETSGDYRDALVACLS